MDHPTGSPTIRRAAPVDAEAVRACLAAVFAPFRDRYTRGAFEDTVPGVGEISRRIREGTVYVAEAPDGEICGTIACSIEPSGEGHLRGMAVLEDLRGTGLADRLLAAAEARLREQGVVRITLETTEPLQRAMRFYERNGYARTGAVGDFFGMPLIAFAKNLPS